MASLQSRIDLPARKPGRSKRLEKMVEKEEVTIGRRSSRSRGPAEEVEELPRTPRGKKKALVKAPTSQISPGKRKGAAEPSGGSPNKQSRTPAKGLASKENIGKPAPPLTPASAIALLSLNSPRQPLSSVPQPQAPVRKGPLFSPGKISAEGIADLLDSPQKSPARSSKSPVRPSRAPAATTPSKNLFCSPVKEAKSPAFRTPLKPALKSRTPCKSPSIHPNKANLFPTASPKRVTVNQLEDLLCSPAKSPIRKVEVERSPRKPASPMKHPSPMKRALFSPSKPTTTPALFTADVSQFQAARSALHTGTPRALLCREKEVGAMSSWLDEHLVAGKPGSIYVSGAPGTGKTATLVSLLSGKVAKYRSIFINCMVLKSSIAIYREVASKLCPGCNPKTEKAAMKIIEEAVRSSKEMILLVLDEVDQLESRDQTVLYTVFEWPALQGSKLALVGIANSLDLTARVLPRLQVKEAYRPTLLHYPPYTKQQLIFIITSRLQEGAGAGSTAVITPRAIAFLASKISALSGDLRKALDVCRRALELAESAVRKQTLLKPMKPTGLANPAVSPRKGYKSPKALPKIGQVDLPQIMKVVNQVYGSQVTASLGTKGEGLPVQQKILVASLLLMVKRGRTKEVTLGKLIDTYSKVLKKRNMKPELESSCVGMIELLESRGMVTYVCKGAPRMAKVSLRMDEDEVGMAFGDKAMLGAIIDDVTCICK